MTNDCWLNHKWWTEFYFNVTLSRSGRRFHLYYYRNKCYDNLFGDIITDIAAAICGGIGLAASGNINPTGAFPSMFEPVHGSAPDIAGKNLADPTATVLSISMMLNHLGEVKAANDVESAVARDLASRGDKKRSTTEIGQALVAGVA